MMDIFLHAPLSEMIGTSLLFVTLLPLLIFSIYDGFRKSPSPPLQK